MGTPNLGVLLTPDLYYLGGSDTFYLKKLAGENYLVEFHLNQGFKCNSKISIFKCHLSVFIYSVGITSFVMHEDGTDG